MEKNKAALSQQFESAACLLFPKLVLRRNLFTKIPKIPTLNFPDLSKAIRAEQIYRLFL